MTRQRVGYWLCIGIVAVPLGLVTFWIIAGIHFALKYW